MQLRQLIDRTLGPEQNRLVATAIVAFSWLLLIVGAESSASPALALLAGLPAVAVLFFWRRRPEIALALSALVLLLVAVSGSGGGVLALTTGALAVAGGITAADRRVRLAAGAFVVLELLLSAFRIGFLPSAMLGLVAGLLALAFRQSRQRRHLEGRLDETTERHEAAERDVLVEIERNRIAREVHDVVAHSLAVVVAQADGARFAAETDPASVAPALEAIADTARRALGEVRTMLHDLRVSGEAGVVPGAHDLAGLVEGVRALGVQVDETVYGAPVDLDRRAGLALYRIAQEALTNAMRHGDRGEPIGFELDWGERAVVLVVTNAVLDGAVPASERAGHGITGMRERGIDAGGDVSARAGANGRFRVRVALPIAPPEEAPPAPAANALSALFGDLARA